MRFQVIVFSAAAVCGMIGACGGSTSDSPEPVPRAEFALRVKSAVCDHIGSCCDKAGYSYDATGCRSALAQSLDTLVGSDESYDRVAAGRCVQAISHAIASCKALDMDSAPCDQVFSGTHAAGQPCKSTADCAPVSGADVQCTQSTCRMLRHGKKGDGCSRTCTHESNYINCGGGGGAGGGGPGLCFTEDGVYCASSGVCSALVQVGGWCGSCVPGAYCSNHTCTAKGQIGSPCWGYGECVDGAYCDPEQAGASTCLKAKADGASCSSPWFCQSGNCQDGTCKPVGAVTAVLCSGAGGTGGASGGGGVGGDYFGTGGY